MPPYAYLYPIPYELYEKYKIRRYGYHGTSHKFVSQKACRYLGRDFYNTNIITCHLGNGSSVTAIKKGQSVDTSMGFTPVEGLMMGTRSGDVDLGVLLYLAEKDNLSMKETNNLFNKKSGSWASQGYPTTCAMWKRLRKKEMSVAGLHSICLPTVLKNISGLCCRHGRRRSYRIHRRHRGK